jgi:hypothetical protein
MAKMNRHAEQRAAQRNLSLAGLRYVITHGQRFRRAGALIYFLRRCDIPEWDQATDDWTRLIGTAVVLTKDGRMVLTAWRNRRDGLKRIKRKPKYSILESANW